MCLIEMPKYLNALVYFFNKGGRARVLKNLLKNAIVKTILPSKGRRPAIYGFTRLMEIIESEQVNSLDLRARALS